MDAPSLTDPVVVPEKAKTTSLSRSSSPRARIKTRKMLTRTKLGNKHRILKAHSRSNTDAEHTSLVTRRYTQIRKRRRKRFLTGLAVILGFFPPVLAIYFVTWLIWRTRPKQQSMRKVRKAIRALEKDQTGVALKQLQEAHYLNPSNSDALYWMGLLLNEQQRQEEAAEALSLVAERSPGLPEVEAALVEAYVALDAPEAAVFHAQRLLDVAPYAPETLLKLAEAFDAAGRIDLAIEALRQAPLHKPVLSDALVQVHYHLGTLYERQGDKAEALYHFKRVYARDIIFEDVQERVAALEEEL